MAGVLRVDAHQHFWQYQASRYPWIDDSMEALRRDFLPSDLRPLLEREGIDQTVAVQARQDLEETRWLLELAEEHPFVAGVVGWVNLCSPKLELQLAEFEQKRTFRGVRHIVQDEPDERFLLRDDFQRGLSLLKPFGLTYDILIYPRQLPAAVALVGKFPEQRFVLDHLAKPEIRLGELKSEWADAIKELGRHPGVYCKLSGLVTEAHWSDWKREDFLPYIDVVLEAFGPDRLMFGSDWPVCTLAASYAEVASIAANAVGTLTEVERAAIYGGTAIEFYGLEDPTHAG